MYNCLVKPYQMARFKSLGSAIHNEYSRCRLERENQIEIIKIVLHRRASSKQWFCRAKFSFPFSLNLLIGHSRLSYNETWHVRPYCHPQLAQADLSLKCYPASSYCRCRTNSLCTDQRPTNFYTTDRLLYERHCNLEGDPQGHTSSTLYRHFAVVDKRSE